MKNNKIKVQPPLLLMYLLAAIPQFSETVYSPALPNIAHDLLTSSQLVQWTLSFYFIGFAIGVLFWGRVSDTYGRKPTLLVGMTVYVLASIFCFSSSHITSLLLARILQGFGISASSVLTQTIAREALSDSIRHRFFATVGFVIAMSIAMGPFIGGYFTQWFDWRANFTLLIVVGIVLALYVGFALPETRVPEQTNKTNLLAVILMLAKDKRVLASGILVAVANGVLFSYFAEAPFLYIRYLHLSSSTYGSLGLGIALASLFGSVTARRLLAKMSIKQLIRLGVFIMLTSSLALLLLTYLGFISNQHQILSVGFILIPMMFIVFGGYGFVMPLTLSTALQKYQRVLGSAGAVFGLFYYLMISLITLGMGAMQNGTVLPMPLYFVTLSGVAVFMLLYI